MSATGRFKERVSISNGSDSAKFLPVAEPDLTVAEEEMLLTAFRSGWISSIGKFIGQFEQEFATFCESRHGVCVSNGTAALHLSLLAAGIGPGDEVIVPALTFVATAAAVRHAGATPVFVDVEPEIGTMDPAAVVRAITSRTRAIVVVHLYGNPADMDSLMPISRQQGLILIEDAAQAHGARYRGMKVGSFGDMATFSFYGNKVITTGEGGIVVTTDSALDARVRFLRDHAMDYERRYWHPEVGYNYRITNLQAAIGLAQLNRFQEITEKRLKILEMYRNGGLEDRFGIKFNPKRIRTEATPWLICVLLPEDVAPEIPYAIRAELKEGGVDTRPYFIPLHDLPPYVNYRAVAADGSSCLTVSRSLSARGFNVPSSGNLTRQDVDRVINTLGRALERVSAS